MANEAKQMLDKWLRVGGFFRSGAKYARCVETKGQNT